MQTYIIEAQWCDASILARAKCLWKSCFYTQKHDIYFPHLSFSLLLKHKFPFILLHWHCIGTANLFRTLMGAMLSFNFSFNSFLVDQVLICMLYPFQWRLIGIAKHLRSVKYIRFANIFSCDKLKILHSHLLTKINKIKIEIPLVVAYTVIRSYFVKNRYKHC